MAAKKDQWGALINPSIMKDLGPTHFLLLRNASGTYAMLKTPGPEGPKAWLLAFEDFEALHLYRSNYAPDMVFLARMAFSQALDTAAVIETSDDIPASGIILKNRCGDSVGVFPVA